MNIEIDTKRSFSYSSHMLSKKRKHVTTRLNVPKQIFTHEVWLAELSSESALMKGFLDEKQAIDWFAGVKWKNGLVKCPYCGKVDRNCRLKGRNREHTYFCYSCHRQFSIRTGSIFSDSRIPLIAWFRAIRFYYDYPRWNALSLARKIHVNRHTATRMIRVLKNAGFSFSSPEHGTSTVE